MRYLHILTLMILSFGLSACWSDNDQSPIEQTLYDTYNMPICFRYSMTYPFELAPIPPNKQRIKRAEVLVAAGILEMTEERGFVSGLGYAPKRLYSLTEKGAKSVNSNLELCYADRAVSKILSIEPIDDRSSDVVFEVSDTYRDEWPKHWLFKNLTPIEPTKTLRRVVEKHDINGYQVRGENDS